MVIASMLRWVWDFGEEERGAMVIPGVVTTAERRPCEGDLQTTTRFAREGWRVRASVCFQSD